MNKIKLIIYTIIGTIITVLIAGLFISNKNLKKDIKLYDNNFKALCLENSKLEDEVIAYIFNVEQLSYLNDSIINDLDSIRKELAIKDKEILQMQHIKTEISTKDSIFIKDTIFRESFVRLDTLLGDEWYKIKLQLEYPNKIAIQAKYVSDINVFAKSSKEIIGTPKKCWLGRMFQKKHKVIRVDVVDKCPYSVIKEKKFVIIE